MKRIHGKIFLLFLILFTSIASANNKYCTYSVKSSKENVFINEPIYITFHARQKTKNEVMFFDLKPRQNPKYEIISIKEKRHEFNYHDAEKTFTYLVFARVSGKINIELDFRIRRASDDAVSEAYTGSRDNVKSIPTTNINIALVSVLLNVKALKQNVNGVGNFKLDMKVDKQSSNSYDAINIEYNLVGTGYLNKNFSPLKNITNTSIFKGKKALAPRASKNGYIYNITWNYAIVAKEDFKITSAKFMTYDYKKDKFILATLEEKQIKIKALNIENLVDDKNSPDSSIHFEKYLDYFYSMMIFTAGFLFAKLLEYLPKKQDYKYDITKNIKLSSSPKELLKLAIPLVHKYKLQKEINELESILYLGSKSSFKEVKNTILKKLESL
jgi:hypothetical protein